MDRGDNCLFAMQPEVPRFPVTRLSSFYRCVLLILFVRYRCPLAKSRVEPLVVVPVSPSKYFLFGSGPVGEPVTVNEFSFQR